MPDPTTGSDPVLVSTPPVAKAALTHACVRCGAPVALDVGLCERCNPLGLKDSSASQLHGTVVIAVILGIVGLALIARLAIAGVGPFPATFVSAAPDGAGLAVTLEVTNAGSAAGQTTCVVTDATARLETGTGFVLSPRIEPGQTVTFTRTVTELGPDVREVGVSCRAP